MNRLKHIATCFLPPILVPEGMGIAIRVCQLVAAPWQRAGRIANRCPQ